MAYIGIMKQIFTFFTALLILAIPASAQEDLAAKAEAHLQDLKSVQARFVQTTHDGQQLVGTFYLNRPGKLRFEYDPPIEDFVVADGFFIYFYDAQMGEQTNAPIGQTLADFILRENISLGLDGKGDVEVREIRESNNLLQIEIVQRDDPSAGSLTLGFSKDPFALKKWRVIDGQGLVTEVELFHIKTGIEHPRSRFVYADPNFGKTPSYNE